MDPRDEQERRLPQIDADDLFLERVRRARRQSPDEKIRAGLELFDLVCALMTAGIRSEFPDADEKRVNELLVERLALARPLENTPCWLTP
ncbi:MAG: hypothetical protein IID40_10375 [Planctomycetes bacterium]|nr:hypothetical protein [Planctomycetota bacterium]